MKHKIREKAIFALIDGNLAGKKLLDIESHLETCDECRQFYEGVSSAKSILRTLDPLMEPPPVNWSRIDASLEASLEEERQRHRSIWSGLALWKTLTAKHKVREKEIFALIDENLTGKKLLDIESHLETCNECSQFYERVSTAKGIFRTLDPLMEPPPVNWSRIDASLEASLEGERQRHHSIWSGLTLWGTLAATAAASVLLFWLITPETLEIQSGPSHQLVQNSQVSDPDTQEQTSPNIQVSSFVVYVAGEATVSIEGDEWNPLSLETPLNEGTRVRTTRESVAGLQFATGHGCRIEPDSQIQLSQLTDETLHLKVEQGRVVCQTEAQGPEVVVSVLDMVASASESAHFSVERQGPQIMILELAEGTLRVPAGEDHQEVSSPHTVELRPNAEGELSPREEADRPNLPEVQLLSRRTISSLQIPSTSGVERVIVDGVEYGPLPLSLRRRPGNARIELIDAQDEALVQNVQIALGPRVVEFEPLVPSSVRSSTHRPEERLIGPRLGTYTKSQGRRAQGLIHGKVERCYNLALKRDPNVRGRIMVRVHISTTGSIQPNQIIIWNTDQDSRVASAVDQCIRRSVPQDRFPPPQGGYVLLELPFALAPQR